MCDQVPSNFQQLVTSYQEKGMRTLAFATNRTIVGLAAISDPLRPDVPAAIDVCRRAGIRIKIVTGDSYNTACEIGRQLGIGPEDIISRARPLDKRQLVETLQADNHVVAVTGDGTNDAPALKAAHVGLSMGNGTAVAKEASDITIIDNSFASITKAVMWGRSLYRNIQRFILFQTTVNIVACVTVLIGAFMGTENPLNVVQMLWVNLIMDTFAAMALASLPPTPDVMDVPPRPRNAFIINRKMVSNLLTTSFVFVVLLCALLWYFKTHDVSSLADLLTARYQPHTPLHPYELTFFFTAFVMFQFWNLFNVGGRHSFSHLKSAGGFSIIVPVILVGQFLIVQFGGEMFGVCPLHVLDWLVIIIATFLVNRLLGLINNI